MTDTEKIERLRAALETMTDEAEGSLALRQETGKRHPPSRDGRRG